MRRIQFYARDLYAMSDKRRWNRIKPSGQMQRNGKLLLGQNLIDCRIVDVSAGGACIELAQPCSLPKHFEFINGRSRMVCRVAWIRGARVGIEYESTKEKSMISSGLSHSAAGYSRLSRSR
jgi:hypothetical protein